MLAVLFAITPVVAADQGSPSPVRPPAADAAPSTAAPQTTSPATPGDLAAKRAELSAQIARLAQNETDPSSTPPPPPLSDEAEAELDLLRTLDLLYLQHQSTIEQREEVLAQTRATADEQKALQSFGPPEAKPYSFLLLDDLRDQLVAEETRHETLEIELADAQEQLETAHEQYDEAEQERRLARDAVDDNEQADQQATLARELKLAELQSAIRLEMVSLRRVELEVMTARMEQCKARQQYLEEKIERIAPGVKFTEQDLKVRLGDLSRYGQQLKRQLKEIESRLQQLDTLQTRVEAEWATQRSDKSIAAAGRHAFQLARRVFHEELSLINQRLRELDQFGHYWEGRYDVANGKADHDDLRDWHESVTSFLDRMRPVERMLDQRIDEIRVDLATLMGRSRDSSQQAGEVNEWAEFESQHLHELADLCENSLLHIKAAQRSTRRFLDDLENRLEPEHSVAWLEKARESLTTCWNYELAAVDDRPITVGKLTLAVAYLLLGILAARILSRLIGNRLLPRCGLNEGAAHAVQSIAFYAMSLMFALLALELVNLPFAAFTFLGGAAAIGIGFGSQNILNNFISGLILLAEQPIRVGDQVDIDGCQGTVEHIGARSTRVRTVANHEILFPNSKLLENKVTNLTLSDDLMQTSIGITLSTVLSVEEARQWLFDAARSHPKVLAQPIPVVLFRDFSETSQSFELNFWLNLRGGMERRIVESEVREKINAMFREAGVAAATTSTAPTGAAAASAAVKLSDTARRRAA